MPDASSATYRFGRFTLDPGERKLLADGKPVTLGARAFDLLVALVEQSGRLVSKNELLRLVWSGLVVEENNLQVQVSALRKLLGPNALATIPGRGYRFELPVEGGAQAESPAATEPVPPPPAPATSTAPPPVPNNLPTRLAPLYGRAPDLATVTALLRRHAVVTIVGAGGMGKTRLAQAAAAELMHDARDLFPQGVWWIELAPVADGAVVAATVARAFGAQLGGGSPEAALVAALASQRLLLVLDNCEHLLDPVARLLESVCAGAPGVHVLVTSQENLKLAEEHVYRLGALGVPESASAIDADEGGAVQLFAARARAVDPRFALTPANASAVLEICRRLDGIPLAIELAAARLPLLGVEGLRARLDERFNLLTAGSRVVLRRHQTLRATFEWSHALLSPEQQTVFRRLGVFAGSFGLQAAQEVVQDAAIDRWAALDHLGALVDKSLVLAEGEGAPRYRLLETSRAYALERLAESGETHSIMRRHAESLLGLLESFASADDHAPPSVPALVDAGLELDNLRAALAMAAREDDALAVSVMAHSRRVWGGAWQPREGFERGLELRRCLHDNVPPAVAARFWLTLATLGLYSNRREAFDAARQAAEHFRALGNDTLRFDALVKAAVMGIRFCTIEEMIDFMTEAERLLTDEATATQRTYLQFVRFRVLERLGRFEEALAAGLRQSAIARESGNLLGANYAMANVVGVEIDLGRFDDAIAHARAAIAELEALGGGDGAGHCWVGLASAYAHQGNAREGLAAGRIAYALLLREEDQRRVLGVLAVCAALDGRAADAARAIGHRDAVNAREGVIVETSWPRGNEAFEAMLAQALTAEERARVMAEGAAMPEEEVVRRALGDGPASGNGSTATA